MRHRVVLYNPRAEYWTMPLALLAIGSALDPARFDVIIVDARLDDDPHRTLLAAVEESTVCVGITVLTGRPILDAVAASRVLRDSRPRVPLVWGGWHPSLFPAQCLEETGADAVVTGQGEVAFREIVNRLATGQPLDGIPGCILPREVATVVTGGLEDINSFPPHNYALIDVARYFERKRKRQLDYVTSQGCRFRCSFCADPAVYRRGWVGLEPSRVGNELAEQQRRFGFDEVSFQDETFFTSPSRVAAIAEEFLSRGLSASWTATLRADQGTRLDEGLFDLCRKSGLRRVMIGVESGSPDVLRRIRKDATVDQVLETAEKLVRHQMGAILNFIVGFPGETEESLRQTLDLVVRLRSMSGDFDAAIFYYRPYPGNPLADGLLRAGYRMPDSLSGWAAFDFYDDGGQWLAPSQAEAVERFRFYQHFAFDRQHSLLRLPLRRLSRWRVHSRNFAFPWERAIVEVLRSRRSPVDGVISSQSGQGQTG